MATYQSSYSGAQIDSAVSSVINHTCGLQGVKVNGQELPKTDYKVDITMPVYSAGDWFPTLATWVESGSAVQPTWVEGEGYASGQYVRIGSLYFINFYIKRRLTSKGSTYAAVGGLPFTAKSDISKQGICPTDLGGWKVDDSSTRWSITPSVTMQIDGGGNIIKLENSDGLFALQFPEASSTDMYDVWIAGSGVFRANT